jgi:hypothetical protein
MFKNNCVHLIDVNLPLVLKDQQIQLLYQLRNPLFSALFFSLLFVL